MNRKKIALMSLVLVLVSVGVMWAGGSQESEGKSFYDQTVKIIIPYGAGGTHDVVSCKFAEIASSSRILPSSGIVASPPVTCGMVSATEAWIPTSPVGRV